MRCKAFWSVGLMILILITLPQLILAEEACEEGDICIEFEAPPDHRSFHQSEDGLIYYFDVVGVGRIRIRYNQTVLYTQHLTYHTEESWAVLEEEVFVEHSDTTIQSVKATLYVDDEIYLFEGDVYVKQAGENPREIWADLLHYYALNKDMKAQGSVRIEDEKYSITADIMEFYEETQNARFQAFEGNYVRILEGKNDFSIPLIEVSLGEQKSLLGWGPGKIIINNVRSSSESSVDKDSLPGVEEKNGNTEE